MANLKRYVDALYVLAASAFEPVYGIHGTPGDGNVPKWVAANGRLEFGTGGGGSSTLAADTDVSVVTPADRNLLIYHSSDAKWHNDTLVAADIPALDASKITTGQLVAARGGTGLDASAAANGEILIGNGSGWSKHTIDAGTGIVVTNTAGRISIAAAGGAGAGGTVPDWVAFHPWDPPASPNANDDEFTATTLAAQWTESVTGTVTHDHASTYPSHIYGTLGAISSIYKLSMTAPDATATFSMTLCLDMAPQQNAGLHQALLFAASSGNDAAYAKLTANTIYLMTQDTGAFNDRQFTGINQHTRHLIHLQLSASNVWSAWWSYDGRAWVLAGGGTFTKSFTVATVGFQIQTSSGATIYGAGLPFAFDFFRYKWKTL